MRRWPPGHRIPDASVVLVVVVLGVVVVEIVVVVLAVVVGGGGKPAPPIWTIEFAGSPRNVATKKSLVLGSNSSPHGPTPSPEAKRLSVGLVRSRTRHRDRAWRPFRRKTLVTAAAGPRPVTSPVSGSRVTGTP